MLCLLTLSIFLKGMKEKSMQLLCLKAHVSIPANGIPSGCISDGPVAPLGWPHIQAFNHGTVEQQSAAWWWWRVLSALLLSIQKVSADARKKIGLPSYSRQRFNFINSLELQWMRESIGAVVGFVIWNVQSLRCTMNAHFRPGKK